MLTKLQIAKAIKMAHPDLSLREVKIELDDVINDAVDLKTKDGIFHNTGNSKSPLNQVKEEYFKEKNRLDGLIHVAGEKLRFAQKELDDLVNQKNRHNKKYKLS